MTTTDAILTAGPSLVALAAIGFAVWQQHRGFVHTRVLADLADTRGVFDEAAMALHRASYARGRTQQAFLDHGEWLGECAADVMGEFGSAGKELDLIRERLAIRLGEDHETVQRVDAANAALRTALKALRDPRATMEAGNPWRRGRSASGRSPWDACARGS